MAMDLIHPYSGMKRFVSLSIMYPSCVRSDRIKSRIQIRSDRIRYTIQSGRIKSIGIGSQKFSKPSSTVLPRLNSQNDFESRKILKTSLIEPCISLRCSPFPQISKKEDKISENRQNGKNYGKRSNLLIFSIIPLFLLFFLFFPSSGISIEQEAWSS